MRKSQLKTSFTATETVVDTSTGEIVSSNVKHHTYIANSKEEFMLLYTSVLPVFIQLSHPAKTVYAYLLMNYTSKTIFEIGSGTRSLISSYSGVSLSRVANALTELKEFNLLFSQGKGMYQINPRYAFKGSTTERNEALKAIIEIGCKNC
jgi:hypothetical protein